MLINVRLIWLPDIGHMRDIMAYNRLMIATSCINPGATCHVQLDCHDNISNQVHPCTHVCVTVCLASKTLEQ